MAKKWNQLLNEALAGIYPALESMSDNELRNVRSAPKKMNSSNCWWLAYQLAPVLSGIAGDLLKSRYQARRKANRAKKVQG